MNDMNGGLGHDSVLLGFTRPGTAWVNEMNFEMNHAPGAGSITQSVDLQSSELPLCHDYPMSNMNEQIQTPQMQFSAQTKTQSH